MSQEIRWLDGLGQSFRLIRYDERGCGLSDREIGTPDLDAFVADLEAVVDAAGFDTFDLLGTSQGGAIATAYAARHPERVRRLVPGNLTPPGVVNPAR